MLELKSYKEHKDSIKPCSNKIFLFLSVFFHICNFVQNTTEKQDEIDKNHFNISSHFIPESISKMA